MKSAIPMMSMKVILLNGMMLLSSQADTFYMKDGSEYVGEIVSEEGDKYILRVEVKKGIRDEITVKKTDVERVGKEDPSIPAYEKLKGLVPTADLMSAEAYENILEEGIQPFLTEYPKSKKFAEVEEMKTVYESELKQVQDGSLKVNGKWVTKEEQIPNQYEFDSMIEFAKFEKLAKNGEFVEALNLLQKLQRDFLHTTSFRNAVKLAEQFIPIYASRLQQMRDAVDEQVKNRAMTLERLPIEDRTRVENIFNEEESKYQRSLLIAEQGDAAFLPVNRFHAAPIDKNIKELAKQSAMLMKAVEKSDVDAGEAYRLTLKALDENDIEAAKPNLTNFRRARAPKKYSDYLQSRLKEEVIARKKLRDQQKREAAEEARKAREEGKPGAEKGGAVEKTEKKVFNELEESTNFDVKRKQIEEAEKAAR